MANDDKRVSLNISIKKSIKLRFEKYAEKHGISKSRKIEQYIEHLIKNKN